MARGASGGGSALRRLVTLVVALAVLALIVTGGLLLHPQVAPVRSSTVTTAGRSAVVCAVGTVPSGSASASPSPSTSPNPSTSPSPASPTPVTPSPAPSSTVSQDSSQGAPGQVAVVASGPVSTATPTPGGRLTASTLGSEKVDLTVDQQGHGARIPSATAPVLLLGEGSMASTGTGAVLSNNTDGDEAGLEAAPCLTPSTSAWFPGIASSGSDRTELVLSNPDDSQAELDLKFYGRQGRVVVPGSPGVVVAGHASRSISLTSLVDVQGPLGVSIDATVGRVSAVARRVRTSGDQPAGADWVVPAASPATTAVIPAVPGDAGSRELVVTNPSTSRASVSIQVLGLQGPYAPTGAESLTVAPESSASVDLANGLAGTSAGVLLTSDQPVTGAVSSTSSRRDAQPDIAVQSASTALVRTGVSAIATTDDADADLVLSNSGTADAQVRFTVFSYDGVVLRTDDVLVAADGTATRRLSSPAPSYVVVQVPDGSAVVGGVVLTRSDGAVAGLSTIPLISPDLASRAPRVEQDPAAGR